MKCRQCHSIISDDEEKCPTCGLYAGPPNVRAAESQEEREALGRRYNEAREGARKNGMLDALDNFDDKMKRTCAVVNVALDFMYQFVTNDKLMYSTYQLGVEGQHRKSATGVNDRHRRTVEAMVFGGYAK